MANPKRRHSVSRKGMRRAHDFLKAPSLVSSPKSGERVRPHEVDFYSGFYKGRDVFKIDAGTDEAAAPEAGKK
jgi:large subunit ribosomal protein L32